MLEDHAATRCILELMTMHESHTYLDVGQLEKARMPVTDLTNSLGVAEAAIGNDPALVEGLRVQTEDENTRWTGEWKRSAMSN